MVIRAVFFDFDGTILDTRKLAENAVVLTLDELGLDYDKDEAFALLGVKMRIIMEKMGVSEEKIEDATALFYEHYTDMVLKSDVKACGDLGVLYELRERSPLVVVSNSFDGFLKAAIKKLKIEDLFESVHGAEKDARKDDVLRRVAGEMGLDVGEVLYVGDRFSDVEYAKKAGMISVAISNECSWSERDELMEKEPDFLIEGFEGLREIIDSL
ncbi:HAD family hydrolase [Methanococcoides sp. SA1]|nr:HAD family hydrolase [Methanococcoides sp. SA1]